MEFDVFATGRADLLAELKEQMLILWREYAYALDEIRSESAQRSSGNH